MKRRLTLTILTALARKWLDQAKTMNMDTEGNRRSALAREACARDLLLILGSHRELDERGRERKIK